MLIRLFLGGRIPRFMVEPWIRNMVFDEVKLRSDLLEYQRRENKVMILFGGAVISGVIGALSLLVGFLGAFRGHGLFFINVPLALTVVLYNCAALRKIASRQLPAAFAEWAKGLDILLASIDKNIAWFVNEAQLRNSSDATFHLVMSRGDFPQIIRHQLHQFAGEIMEAQEEGKNWGSKKDAFNDLLREAQRFGFFNSGARHFFQTVNWFQEGDREEQGQTFRWRPYGNFWHSSVGGLVLVFPPRNPNKPWRVLSSHGEYEVQGEDAEKRAFVVADSYAHQVS